ncbi:MAG: DUF3471 domain-containing protein [Myxococcales bacterium]|nr:DUF3471 domain-containing protein [Myxococcales bacterium]
MRTMTELRRPGGMQPAQHIALAWNVLVSDEHELFWKNGSVGGFRAFLGWDARTRRGVVALANAQTAVGLDDIGLHLLDPAIPVDLTVPQRRVAIALAPAVLERYVGSYRYSDTDVLTVTREGAQLFAQAPGMPRVPIYPESERDFFYKVINAQLTFEASGAGRATAAIWHQGGQDQRGERIAP